MDTRGLFSSVKQVFFTFLEHLNRMLGSSLIATILLTKNCPHVGCHVLQRFKQRNPWILHILIIERSTLARCNVLIIRNTNTFQTICSASFAPFLSCSFFFFLFFFDDAMRGTTTQGQRPPRQRHVDNNTPHHTTPHHTTPHHTTQPPNQQRTTRTRHDTAPHNKKHKDTHVHAHACFFHVLFLYLFLNMYVYVYESV